MSLLASVLPEQKQERPKEKRHSYKRVAGKINVRIVEYRKENKEGFSKSKQFNSRLLIVHDEQDRQYTYPIDIGPEKKENLNKHLETVIFPGMRPSPDAWEQKTENTVFMLKDGFEFYDEHHIQIDNVVEESV